MTSRSRRLTLAVVELVLGLFVAGAALAADYPSLLWTVSDDTLVVPFGAIADVAIGSDGVVFLLDTQNMAVRRIAPNGAELPSLGRGGEGPGEFLHPRLVTAYPGGGCLVIQDFYAPATCLTPDDKPCVGPDLSLVRAGFGVTQFLGCARSDDAGRLLVTAMTADYLPDPKKSAADVPTAWSVFRIGPRDLAPTILFSNRPELCGESTVSVSEHIGHYTLRCWDVDGSGRLIYADPVGRYRVIIGHPADGESRVIDLPPMGADERALERLAKSTGRPLREVPRIADVQWLNDGCFLVKPMATVTEPTNSLGGTVELFDSSGKSLGRRAVHIDYDPARDAFFLRSRVLVIIKGGRSAMEVSLGLKSSPGNAPSGDFASDVIRVHAYNLGATSLRQ